MWQRAMMAGGGSGGGSWQSSTVSVTIPANGSVDTHIDTANKSVYIASVKNNARIAALIYNGQVLDSTVKNYLSVTTSITGQIVLSQTTTSSLTLTLNVYTQG